MCAGNDITEKMKILYVKIILNFLWPKANAEKNISPERREASEAWGSAPAGTGSLCAW